MKQLYLYILLFILIIIFIFIPTEAFAHDNPQNTVSIEGKTDRNSLKVGELINVFVTIYNSTPITLTNVSIVFAGENFKEISIPSLNSTIPAYSGVESDWTLQSKNVGSQNLIFSIKYSWLDSKIIQLHEEVKLLTIDSVTVNPKFSIEMPNFIIPLLIGAAISLCATFFTDWVKGSIEQKRQEEQAKGVVTAILLTAQKAIESKEKVSFGLWEEAIIKVNLFPALYRLGKALKHPDLSRRLAELTITINDYNDRQEKANLTETFITSITNEISGLVTVLNSKE